MRINTQLKYGIRTLVEIARGESMKEGVKQKVIARNQSISEKYLDRIIADLKNADLIRNVKGKRSGYRLARLPENITIDQVFRAFNQLSCTVNCLDSPEACNLSAKCPARLLWVSLNHCIADHLKSVTLKDMLNQSL